MGTAEGTKSKMKMCLATSDELIFGAYTLQKTGLAQPSFANNSLDELEQKSPLNVKEIENDIKVASWTLYAGAITT